MTADATTATPESPTAAAPIGLQLLGDASAAACEGDSCLIPATPAQLLVNNRLDADLV